MPREKHYASYKSLAPKVETPVYTCIEITDLHQRQKLIRDVPILCIDLWAKWCEPCKAVKPRFADLAQQYNIPNKCLLVTEDVDLDLTRDYQITGIPAFIFYVNGKLLRNGSTPSDEPVSVIGGNIEEVKDILDILLNRTNN